MGAELDGTSEPMALPEAATVLTTAEGFTLDETVLTDADGAPAPAPTPKVAVTETELLMVTTVAEGL